MDSFAAVIDAFGVARAAEVLGVPPAHARVFKARDNIPADYFKRLVDAAQADGIQGLTYDLLYRLREARASRRSSAQEAAA